MADMFKYPVFFECSSLQPETIKKIPTYFQIRRQSGGGECGPVKKVDGNNQTTIYSVAFKDQKDQQAVLQKSQHRVDGLVFTVRDSPWSCTLSPVPTSPESQDLSAPRTPAPRPPPPDEKYEQTFHPCIFQYLKDCPKAEQELEHLLESFGCYAELHLEDGRLLVQRSAPHGAEDEARNWKAELDQFFYGYRCSYEKDHQRMEALFESCQTPDEVHVYRGVDRAVVVGKRPQVEARLKKVEERLRLNEKPTSHQRDLEPSHQGRHQLLDLRETEKFMSVSQDISERTGEAASNSLRDDSHGSSHGSLHGGFHGGPHDSLHGDSHGGLHGGLRGDSHGGPHGGPHDSLHGGFHGDSHGGLRGDSHGGLRGDSHDGLHGDSHGGFHGDSHGGPHVHKDETTGQRSVTLVNSRGDHETTFPENPNHRKALHGAGPGDGREFSPDRDFHRNGARGAAAAAREDYVQIVHGTLETQKVDALVSPMVGYDPCSTRVGITLSKMVESQLKITNLKLKTGKARTPGDVVMVDGFSRSKHKAVFFLNLMPWDGKDGSAPQVMRLGISSILDACQRRGFTSVAFPVLGAGVALNFPCSSAARILLEEVEKFKQHRGRGTSLRVSVAIHPKDKESSEKFKSELKAWRHGTSV